LYGANEYQASLIDQWADFYLTHFAEHVWRMVGTSIGFVEYDSSALEHSKRHVSDRLRSLDKYLEGREWFVGNRVTLADIIMWGKTSKKEKMN